MTSSVNLKVRDRRPVRTIPQDLKAFLLAHGCRELRFVGAVVCGLRRFNFTTGLVVGLTFEGYERRYCYEYQKDARSALAAWDGLEHPGGPWIKCKGAGIDLLNPALVV
ncbi:hypothetical protein [Acidovorax sp. SDU_ACID1]|uniref:hypothetical protein n=1 Tax=Acidovorax sp. SDU_ACID1 TaxID=3136632 RepID=UPI003872DB35